MADAPSRNDLSKADYYLKLFEQQVEKAHGRPLNPSNEQKEALRRVKELREAFPDNPEVDALFARTREALSGSKGGGFQITPAMLAYRDQETRMVAAMGRLADEAWSGRHAAMQAEAGALLDAFPAPDPEKGDPDQIIGRSVLLTDFCYPDNQFQDTGAEYVFVGDRQRGYYFVRLSCRAWHTAYAALARFRDGISGLLPTPWTVEGRITGVTLLVPQAEKDKTVAAALGWVVEPTALYLPGKLLALAAAASEEQGHFIGEEQTDKLRAGSYSVTELPKEDDPVKLVVVFAAAIKEKNWELFRQCVDKSWLATPTALSHLRYYWQNNQERYRTLYVHVEPEPVKEVLVLRGEKVDNDESFFLSEEQLSEMKSRAEPLLEQALVPVRRYDERGRQVGSPSPIFLRREEGQGWRIYSGFPL